MERPVHPPESLFGSLGLPSAVAGIEFCPAKLAPARDSATFYAGPSGSRSQAARSPDDNPRGCGRAECVDD